MKGSTDWIVSRFGTCADFERAAGNHFARSGLSSAYDS